MLVPQQPMLGGGSDEKDGGKGRRQQRSEVDVFLVGLERRKALREDDRKKEGEQYTCTPGRITLSSCRSSFISRALACLSVPRSVSLSIVSNTLCSLPASSSGAGLSAAFGQRAHPTCAHIICMGGFIHPSAWKGYSANFVLSAFSEVRPEALEARGCSGY